MAVTAVTKPPNLVRGDPGRYTVDLKVKVYMCLGRRPIPIGAENSEAPPRDVHKVALGPSATEADAHTFASLRSHRAASRASISSFVSCRS